MRPSRWFDKFPQDPPPLTVKSPPTLNPLTCLLKVRLEHRQTKSRKIPSTWLNWHQPPLTRLNYGPVGRDSTLTHSHDSSIKRIRRPKLPTRGRWTHYLLIFVHFLLSLGWSTIIKGRTRSWRTYFNGFFFFFSFFSFDVENCCK